VKIGISQCSRESTTHGVSRIREKGGVMITACPGNIRYCEKVRKGTQELQYLERSKAEL
jgi:hypothetical protein